LARWPTPLGAQWQRELPARIARLVECWDLVLDPPYLPGGVTSYVAPARRADGSRAVLKIVIPHREMRDEAVALRVWNGNGAIALLDSDRDEHALLLEHCDPGTSLRELTDEDAILDIGADVLLQLWAAPAPAEPFEPLEAVTEWFADLVTERQQRLGRPLPQPLVDEAVEALRELPRSATRRVVLHHDFHPGNVLAATRAPWLAIDPKPQVGDPAFDPLQLILQTGEPLAMPDPAATLRERVLRLSERLGLEPDRLRSWGVGRCVEWSLSRTDDDGPLDGTDDAEFARLFSAMRC
jgi:streptomycin 6-kinase